MYVHIGDKNRTTGSTVFVLVVLNSTCHVVSVDILCFIMDLIR